MVSVKLNLKILSCAYCIPHVSVEVCNLKPRCVLDIFVVEMLRYCFIDAKCSFTYTDKEYTTSAP